MHRLTALASLLMVACVKPAPLRPPTGVTATATAKRTISVSWTPPASNGGKRITSYTVTASPSGPVVTVDAPPAIMGALPGRDFSFTVHATNAEGDGPESEPSNRIGRPTVPTIVAVEKGDNSATLKMAPPVNDGGSPIETYVVRELDLRRSWTLPVAEMPVRGGLVFATIDLPHGRSFRFQASAGNAFADGPESAPLVVGSTLPCTSKESDATICASRGATCGSVTGWDSCGNQRTVEDCGTCGGEFPNCGCLWPSPRSQDDACMTADGNTYSFFAQPPDNICAACVERSFQSVCADAPCGYFSYDDGCGHTRTISCPSTSLMCSWCGDACGEGSVGDWPSASCGECAPGQTCVYSGQINYVTGYPYAGWCQGPPAPPFLVMAVAEPGGATVTWQAPEGVGGSPVSFYEVVASPGGASVTTDGETTRAAFTGLTPGTSYRFTVTAVNAYGSSTASNPSNEIIPTP